MTLTFFLDESGGAGDAAKAGRDLGFGGQRVSVLAAIGTEDPDRLATGIADLSARHGLKSGEIKSTGVANLTGLAAGLADMLWRDDLPLFVEVVDKRYLLVANLLNNLLMPPVPGFDEKPGSHLFRAVVGDVVFHSIPDRILHAFVDICAEPSRQRVAALVAVLRRWVGRQDRDAVRQMLLDSLDDADAILADGCDDRAHLHLLPAPDPSVTGRQVWMLPALSSLTNVYARINKSQGGAIAGIRLVHDEDMLHGGILVEAKRLMEELAAAGAVPAVPHADYTLREHAELSFADSASTPGIQAADVIAGFVMRFVRDFLAGTPPTARRVDAMARIGRLSDVPRARGVNYVMSKQHLAEMDVPWA